MAITPIDEARQEIQGIDPQLVELLDEAHQINPDDDEARETLNALFKKTVDAIDLLNASRDDFQKISAFPILQRLSFFANEPVT